MLNLDTIMMEQQYLTALFEKNRLILQLATELKKTEEVTPDVPVPDPPADLGGPQ